MEIRWNICYPSLLYLSVSARAVIGLFKAVYDAKMFRDLSPSVLTFIARKSSKLPFTSEIVY